MKTVISFRLRKELDADLIELVIDENSLPDLCRNGLRLMLGIQTAKQMELKERPIVVPRPAAPAAMAAPTTFAEDGKPTQGKSTIYKPKLNGRT